MSEYVYIVKETFNRYELYKVEILKRTDKRVTTKRCSGTRWGSVHDPVSFDAYYKATPEEAISFWRRSILSEIEVHHESIKRLEKALTIEPAVADEDK